MLTQEGSIEDASVKLFQAQVVQEYKGDWQRFFIEWREKQEKQHKEVIKTQGTIITSQGVIIKKLDKRALEAELNEKALLAKYESLYEKHMEMHKKMTFLYEKEQRRQELEQSKDQAKLKKKQAKKQDLRQTVSTKQLNTIMEQCVKGRTEYVRARRRVAITIMYLTGLRVTNLLLINAAQLQELTSKGYTSIQIIKNGPSRHNIRLAYRGKKIMGQRAHDVKTITHGKEYNAPAFTPQKQITEPINKDVHEKELNDIMKQASKILSKHLRTHSFRATLITDLLKNGAPVEKVKDILGHSSIYSTLAYNRNKLTIKEIDKLMTNRFLNHDQ